jgi:hypothetical protein
VLYWISVAMQHPPVHPMADIPTVTRSHHPALNFALIKKSIPLFPNVVHPTIQEFELHFNS